MGNVYEDLSKFNEAEEAYRRSLAIREKTLGSWHPLVAETLNNLGLLLTTPGRYREAESLLKRSLVIHEKVFGTEHSKVAISLAGLANIYAQQGRHNEAEAINKRRWQFARGH